MNNKGQTLVIFVILIPLFVLILALVIDTSIMFYHKNRLNSINKTVVNYSMNHIEANRDKILQYIKKNDEDIKVEVLDMNEKTITLKLSKEIHSLFGNVVKIKSYTIRSGYKGTIETKKIEKIEE